MSITAPAVTSTEPVAGTYDIDPAHSAITLEARHLVFTKARASFGEFSGTVVIADDPTASSVELDIQAASIDSKQPDRDGHLRSPEFLDAETHPAITVRSVAVRPVGNGRWDVEADVTARGITRRIALDTEFLGATTDPWGGYRVALSAATEIDREDFGMAWNVALDTGGVVLGRKVKVQAELEAVRRS